MEADIAAITVKVDDAVLVAALDGRAREHGTTPEQEASELLARALMQPDNMATRLRARFEPLGGADLFLLSFYGRDPPFLLDEYDHRYADVPTP